MSRLYFDHNVSHHVGPLLWPRGHDLVFSRNVGTTTLTDDAVLLFACTANRIFITHNRKDFRMLHDAWLTWPAAFGMALPQHPGILVLDQASPETLAHILGAFLEATPTDLLPNALYWWHRHDGWHRLTADTTWEPFTPPRESSSAE